MENKIYQFGREGIFIACLVVLITISAIYCTQRNSASDEKIIWHSSSISMIDIFPDDHGAIIENHIFLPAGGTVITQATKWRRGKWEGNQPSLEATAYQISPDGKQKELWSIHEEADEGRLDDGFYHTIWYGCCAASPNHRLYHLETGNLIMEYCDELLRLEMPNTQMKRYIGYKPAETITTNSWEKDEKHIGTLTYSSPSGIIRRIAFRGISEDYENKFGLGFADIFFEAEGEGQVVKETVLRLFGPSSSADAKSFADVRIRLQFFAGASIEILIIEDDLYLTPDRFKDFEIIRVGLKANPYVQ